MTTDFPMNFRRPLATVCMVAIAFLRTGAASASGLPVPLPPGPHRPDADSGPTKVSVGMWTADIVNVDSARQTFEGSIYIVLRWHDPHLAHSEPGITTYALNDIWYPKWSAENGSGSLRQILPEKVEVTVDGTVIWRQQFLGSFTQKLDLHKFPFDKQRLRASFVVLGCRPEEIQFVPDESMIAAGCPQGAGMAGTLTLADWKVNAPSAFAETYHAAPGLEIAGYVLEFPATRLSGYYLLKVIVPLLLIVFMSWAVFWIDPALGGSQISVATTSMLTLIAYRFAIGADLPKLPYLTNFDSFMLASSLLIFFALMEVIVTTNMPTRNQLELSRLIDCRCRIIFPLIFVIFTTVIFLK